MWQPSPGCLSNSVDSGFPESQQLEPNVITVFVKRLDKRLRGGYGCVCSCMCVWNVVGVPLWGFSSSYSSLNTACPSSCEGSAHHRRAMKWVHCATVFVLWLPLIMTPLSFHSWRGQGAGRRGVKDRSANPHLVKTWPLLVPGTHCLS